MPIEDAVEEKLVEILTEQLGVDASRVTVGARFEEDLGADSLDSYDLALAVEEEYEIEMPDDVIEKLKTVGDLQTYIRNRRKS